MTSLNPSFGSLAPSSATTVNVSNFYSSEGIALVPDTVAPYLAAHGFLVTGGTEHYIDGEFAGYLLNMHRQSFSHANSIQVLINAMVFAYNEGRTVNNDRYEDILSGLQQSLAHQQSHVSSTELTFNSEYSLFIADLDSITADSPTLADWTTNVEQLILYANTFDDDTAAAIVAFIATLGTLVTDLPTLAEFNAIVDTLNTKIDAYDNNAILSGQLAVYLTDVAGLTDDAPEISDWTAALTTLAAKLDAFDVAIASLIASYELDASGITTAIATALTEVDTALALYRTEVAALKAKQATIEGNIKSLLAIETSDLAGHVINMNTAFDALDDQYDTHLASANAALAAMETAISDFSVASASIISEMETDLTAHTSTISTLLGEITTSFDTTEATLIALLTTIDSDYTSHSTTATAFLTDLGATDLARINEEYDDKEASINQGLVNRGFYSSAIPTQVAVQIARERSERISQLNDQLNREKFENQHQLYGQQQAMRGTHISVHQGLLQLEQQTIQFRTSTRDGLNARSLDVKRLSLQSRQETEKIRQGLFQMQVGVAETFSRMFTEIKSAIVSGLGQLQGARLAVSRGQVEDYQKIFSQIAETYGRSLEGEEKFAAFDVTLRGQEQTILTRIEELGQSWASTEGGLLETGIKSRTSTADIDSNVRMRYHDIVLRQKVSRVEGRLGGIRTQADVLEAGLRNRGISAQVSSEVKRAYYDLSLRHKLAEVDGQRGALDATITAGQAVISARATAATTDANIRQAYYDLILRQQSQKAQLRLSGATGKAELLDRHVNETTNVAAALFGFAERREDDHPSIGDMAALVTSLGDDE